MEQGREGVVIAEEFLAKGTRDNSARGESGKGEEPHQIVTDT
jgi:hypothetical protein